ncbi:MAG: group II truncated hemoglobin [Planctomycetota bacterium]
MSRPFGPDNTPYDAIGGESRVRALADAFYDRVEHDSPLMKTLHPPDLTESREKFFEFLSGWLGGPPIYMQKRGHPRLRMRHAPFPIDENGVSEWLRCMRGAMDELGVDGDLRVFLEERFTHTAEFMRNR